MAYSGKFVSIKQVIEKVYRDSGIDSIDMESAIEWATELVGLIGVPQGYVDKTTNGNDSPVVEVSDFKAMLPYDLVRITSIRKIKIDESGAIIGYDPMNETMDVFQYTRTERSMDEPIMFDPISPVIISTLDENDELISEDAYVTGSKAYSQSGIPYSYKINGNYIFTNFDSGYIEIAYKGYPIDSDGIPVIPDDEKYISALKFYIIYKIDWKNWRSNPASPGLKALVNDSEQQMLFYVAAAKNKAHIPSLDMMESIKNMWLRSIPKVNEHATGFSTTDIAEMRYNQYRNRRTSRRL